MQVEVAQGNTAAAKQQYEMLLGKALRGYGTSEFWTHAEYAPLLAAEGDLDGAVRHLQMAADVASLPESSAEPAALAGIYLQLGEALLKRGDSTQCACTV